MNTIKIECPSCNGTGVYAGMAEREGAAVVCVTCKGSGCTIYTYKDFTGLKTAKGIKRVYKHGYGYFISTGDVVFGAITVNMNKEGVSYSEFLSGKKPNHIEKIACPMLADQHECQKIKGFNDECSELHGSSLLGININKCNQQANKAKCWDRFYRR